MLLQRRLHSLLNCKTKSFLGYICKNPTKTNNQAQKNKQENPTKPQFFEALSGSEKLNISHRFLYPTNPEMCSIGTDFGYCISTD